VSPADIARALGKAHRTGNEWSCLCPAHEDHNPSFTITERGGKLYFHCHRGCDQQAVMDALTRRGLWGQPEDDGNGLKAKIAATYDYNDETSRMLFQTVRLVPKSFRQRRPDGVGGWVWKLDGVRLVPYRLDELVEAAKAGPGWKVTIVEGEKDVDKLVGGWGTTATCNPMGAGKWRSEFNPYFKDADATIISDNDAVGRDHATHVAKELLPVARTVKVLHLAGLPEKGDISDWIAAGGTEGELDDLIDAAPLFDPAVDEPLAPEGQPKVRWFGDDPTAPKPRQWLLGTNFCRGFLSGLTGAGATGKSAIRLLQLLALGLDRGDLVGERVFHRTRVLVVCLEDDEEEQRRRFTAACKHHGLNPADVVGWVAYWTPRNLRLLDIDLRGQVEPGPLGDALKHIIRRLDIGLVTIDPFVKSHGANENDNVLVDRAASLLLQVAFDCGCACDYVHHHKKGLALAGDKDAGRGASALADASRLVKTATKMSIEEAQEFGVDDFNRKLLVRLDDAKINIAPPADQAVWFKLIGVDIDNGTPDYPAGDNVQTVERWYPPAPPDLQKSDLVQVFEAVRCGPKSGEFYSADPRTGDYWLVPLVQQVTGLNETRAERLVGDWIKNRVLIEDNYVSAARRSKEKMRVTLNETKAAEILGPLYRPPPAEE
jgi:hypothetical protein